MENNQIDLRISQELVEHEQTITKIFTVSIWDTIADVKKLVSQGFGIPEDKVQLKLTKNGKERALKAEKSIIHYDLEHGDTVELELSSDGNSELTPREERKMIEKRDRSKTSARSMISNNWNDRSKSPAWSGYSNNKKGRSKSPVRSVNSKVSHKDKRADSSIGQNKANMSTESSSDDEKKAGQYQETKSLIQEQILGQAVRLIKEIKENKPQSVKKLLDDIILSHKRGHAMRMRLIIDSNVDNGWNSLHYAVFFGLTEVVKELIDRNPNINKVTDDGWTPLQIAINQNNELICKMLLEAPNVNVNLFTAKATALHLAAANGNKKLAQLLLFNNADLTAKDMDGRYPYEVTSDKQIAEMIQISERDLKKQKVHHLKEEIMPPKPTLVKGWLRKLGVFMNHKKRYFILDPNEFTFSHYMTEADYPAKPRKVVSLTKIKDIRRVEGGLLMKKEYFYFEVHYEGKARLFACRTKDTLYQWIDHLRMAYAYASYVESKYRQHLNFVQNFDEESDSPTKLHSSYFVRVDATLELLDRTESEERVEQKKQQQEKIMRLPCDKNSALYIAGFDYPENTDACIDDFDAVSQLGQGAFGVVFKVKRRSDGKLFAMKTIQKKTLFMKNQLKSATTEKEILQKAQNPFVLQIECAFQTRDHLYLCLEYCPGGDLSAIINDRDKINDEQIRLAAAELIIMIDYLHSINVLYRDMKPDNLLLDEEGHLKIIDFGLSKLGVKSNVLSKSFCGSPAYLAPEMFRRQGATWATDIYGIGAIIYELIYGDPPFYSNDIETIEENMRKGKIDFSKGPSPAARDLLMKLLDPNPLNRLGVTNKKQIMDHPYFDGIDWSKMAKKELPAPFPKNPAK